MHPPPEPYDFGRRTVLRSQFEEVRIGSNDGESLSLSELPDRSIVRVRQGSIYNVLRTWIQLRQPVY